MYFQAKQFYPFVVSIVFSVLTKLPSVIGDGFGIALMTVPSEDLAQKVCTTNLLRKYFNTIDPLSGSVLLVSISLASAQTQEKILKAFHSLDDMPWSIVVKNARIKPVVSQTLYEKPQCYFIVIENMEDDDLEYVFEDWQSSVNWNPLAQFVVLLASVEETNEEMTEIMAEILLSFMNKKIYNVNVIGQSDESVSFFGKSVFPYHPDNNCGNRVTSVQVLDVCTYQESAEDSETEAEDDENEEYEDGQSSKENVTSTETETATNSSESIEYDSDNEYPKLFINEVFSSFFEDKFPKDLSGCPLKAAYRSWEPYIFANTYIENETDFMDNDKSVEVESDYYQNDDSVSVPEKQTTQLNGIEFKMVQTIAQYLHLTIEINVKLDNLYLLYQKLLDGDVEMLVGGIDEDPSTSQFVSTSVPYFQDDLTWCVTKAKRKYNLFSFLESFKIGVWLLTIAFIIVSTFNIRLTQKLLNINLTNMNGGFAIFLKVFGTILTQSMPIKHVPNILKLTFGSIFFMGFIITNIYQSFLVSILTTPKSSYQIKSLSEIYYRRMAVAGGAENVRHFNKEGEIFNYIQRTFEVCYQIEDCLNQAATDENLAVAVSRMHYLYNPRIKRDQLYCFSREENLYIYLVTMVLPKKFHLLYKINNVVQHVIESGIMQKWASELDMRRQIDDLTLQQSSAAVKSLTLQQTGGSFALLQALLFLAGIIFILELYVYKQVAYKRTKTKIFRFLHKRFTGLPTKQQKSNNKKDFTREVQKKKRPIHPFIH